MAVVDRFRALLQRASLTDEAREVFDASKSADELIEGFERVLGRNRIEYDQRYEELVAVSKMIATARATLERGGLDGIDEDRLMDDLELRLAQHAPLKTSVRYLKSSMKLHYLLIGQLREMQAAELRGVKEDDIDGIMEKVKDEMDAYTRDMAAGEVDEETFVDPAKEEAERAERRRRLLGNVSGETEDTASAKKVARDGRPRKTESE